MKLLERAARAAWTVVVLPHHGNPDPMLPQFLGRLRPALALVSRGEEQDFVSTRSLLKELGIPFLSTHQGGSLLLPVGREGASLCGIERGSPQVQQLLYELR